MFIRLAKGAVFAVGVASLGRVVSAASDSLGEPGALPELPPEWADQVLRDLASVDVERWRRFTGTVVHASEADGHHWELALSRGAPFEPGADSAWWRHDGPGTTVPELIGRLRATTLRAGEDAAIGTQVEVNAAVELVHGRDGRNNASLRLTTFGTGVQRVRLNESYYECVVPSPAAECESGAADEPAASPAGWSGFPPPLTPVDAFPERPLSALDGGRLYLASLVDLRCDPSEVILEAETAAPASEPLRLRIAADGDGVHDRFPELDHPSDWNAADALDLDYVIDEWSLDGDVLSFRGDEWAIELFGDRLSVRLEATR